VKAFLLSSNAKSLSKREVPWSPLNPPGSTPVLYFNKCFQKKLTNKYAKSTRVGTIVDQTKVLKQAEIMHNSKTVVSLLCMPYKKKEIHSRDTTVLIDLL